MEQVNSLIIIASAFSVFGQYIDNNHRNEFQTLKSDIRELDFSDADCNDGLAKIKEQWDDLLGHDCLRAKNQVSFLFSYLVLIVAVVTVWGPFMLVYGISGLQRDAYEVWAIFTGGLLLLGISAFMVVRLLQMGKEKIEYQRSVSGLLTTYDAVRSAIKSAEAPTS